MGKVLKDRYELLTELGRGGMSTVYLARDLNLGSYWAVKHMKNNGSTELIAFKQEVELLAGLSHPDIPRIVDRIEEYDDYYVVMDFVDGVSLGKKTIAEGPVDEETLVGWAKMLCSILTYLHTVHDSPIVYRDMKPDNIILSQSGRVKLIDFGIAKECKRGVKDTGECFGTRGYAAPEQYKSGSNILDERTDIYSLGCTMFYLLTGKVPGKSPNACPPLRTINPNLSDGIQYIVAKATQDDPAQRYSSADEMLGDLEHIGELSSEYKDKMRKRLILFLSCFILSLIFLGVGIWGKIRIDDKNMQTYDNYYRIGFDQYLDEDYDAASKSFATAIEYDPDNYSAYEKLFDSKLPHKDAEDSVQITRNAINYMCDNYIDNENSVMYHDPRLMYMVVPKCIDACDALYYKRASEYIRIIREEKTDYYNEHADEMFDLEEYRVLADSMAKDSDGENRLLYSALNDLEEKTDRSQLTAEKTLQNYYTLIKVYASKLSGDSYMRLQAIGEKAEKLIDQNKSLSDEFEFPDERDMYNTLFVAFNSGGSSTSAENALDYYSQALHWYDRMIALYPDADTDIMTNYNKGEVFYKIYENRALINKEKPGTFDADETTKFLMDSISIFESVKSRTNELNSCTLYLGQAYAERAYITGSDDDKTMAKDYYLGLKPNINSLSLNTRENELWKHLEDLMIDYQLIPDDQPNDQPDDQ